VADEFKLAGAYVEINLRDNTSGDEKKIRARIESEKAVSLDTALNDPKNTKAIKEKIERGPAANLPVTVDNPITDAWRRKIQASIRSTATSAIDVPVTPETTNFHRDLEASLKKASGLLKTEIPVAPEDAAKFRAQLEAMVDAAEAGVKAHISVEVDKASAAKADSEMEKVAKRANDQFDALKFTGLSVGLPAAAAIGAAGVTGALLLPAAAFAALAFSAASSSDAVQIEMQQLSSGVQSDVKAASRPLEDEFVSALDHVSDAWGRMRPAAAAAIAGTGPLIDDLAGTVTDFAEESMPGMVTAVRSAGPPLEGLRSFAGSAGAGLTDFFTNASKGADGAKTGFTTLGITVQLLEGRLGTLFANLANGSAGPLSALHVIVDQATGALVDLTAQGSPAIGFLTGFGGAAGGTLTIIRGLLSVLGLLPAGVAQVGGSIAATGMLLSKFGVDVGAGFEGLGGKISAAEGAGGKFKAGMSGLVAGALSPATLAVAVLGVGLGILGQKQQEAAATAAAHTARVSTLSQVLRENNGVINDNVRASAAKELQDVKVSDGSRNLLGDINTLAGPQGMQMLTDSYLGNADQGKKLLDQLKAERDQIHSNAESTAGATDEEQRRYKLLELTIPVLEDVNGTYQDSIKKNNELKIAMKDTSIQFAEMSPAAIGAAVAAASLTSAFTTLNTTTGDVAAKGAAIISVLGTMSGAHYTEEEALQAWNDQMRTAGDLLKGLDLKTHAKDFIDAGGAINTASEAGSKFQNFVQAGAAGMATYAQALKEGGASTEEITAKLGPMRTELEKQLHAWGLNDSQIKTILDHYGAIPDKITTVLKVEGGEESQIQVQQVIADLLKVPADKGIQVTALTGDAIENLTALGKTVVKLPDGSFQVFANTGPGKEAADKFVKDNDGRVVTTKVDADTDPAAAKSGLLMNGINESRGLVTVDAVTAPADAKVADWSRATSQVVGNTTTYTQTDPASGQVQQWKSTTDATGARTTTYSSTDPATGAVRVWKQNADGTWGTVTAYANTAAANAALDNAARNRTATIFVNTIQHVSSIIDNIAKTATGAKGGLAGPGGFRRFRAGGPVSINALDVGPGGLLSGPGTGTSDSILARVANGEYVEPADQTAKYLGLLEAIRKDQVDSYLTRHADGGLVGAAQEILGQLNNNGMVYEDFSFKGNSDNVRANNDTLLQMFAASGNSGDSSNAADQSAWLLKFINGNKASAPAVSSPAHYPKAAPTAAGPVNNFYNTFNVQEVDVYTLATLVSRELEMRSKTGAFV